MMQLDMRRKDATMATIVDRGILLQHLYGTKYAANYLSSHNVKVDVTIRVLTRPGERRNPDMVKVAEARFQQRHIA